ncbi:aminoacyl-tRNA hydrolase [Pseudomaricurvus alkylphenolicus]|uniref:aminoacyl-tRNA hydrolase n=1 Tax=Pseudomaricurvus alkylphenolicus TaxID=1306991 RepID=UPI001422888A|nr:aminoacyl-tRNA hydrolase [Pseudomaricurvus alkylphenolicus]NIB40145.1 aminoacyl-tRNA hydrolase [Pseudomaricurvus alkylphenolicus]
MDTPIQMIVGLGNPGAEYDLTRHNAGADFVTEVARQCGASLAPEKKFFGHVAQINIDNRPVRLLIPTTFMNRSGQSVAALANFYKIAPEAILVAHDELDMEPGIAKLKIGGGHGGHNGLRDIISALGNNKNFARLRLGIGHPGNAKQVASYVLKKAPTEDFNKTEDAIYQSTKILPLLVKGEWNNAMKELHTA